MQIKTKRAITFFQKLIGLMFQDQIQPLYFETRGGIHTCFVKQPIIVLVLNKRGVVKYKKKLKPWHCFFWSPQYSRVLELPTSDKFQSIQVGDHIKLQYI